MDEGEVEAGGELFEFVFPVGEKGGGEDEEG